MINLTRRKDNRWILQKNISEISKFFNFLEAIYNNENEINKAKIKTYLKSQGSYHGRSDEGSSNTMGVRLSQLCFYLFGYRKGNKFIPTITTDEYFNSNLEKNKLMLINLYGIQFPSPYSKTPDNFKVYAGRLIVKLLLEERINSRLYIDEIIYFLPFIETINQDIYEELIQSILEFRQLDYDQKYKLYSNIYDFNNLFANCAHEFNYYFIRIFESLGVFEITGDPNHNNGNIFKFKHSKDTFRNDAYKPRKNISGYISLNHELVSPANLLINSYSPFDKPIEEHECLTQSEWIREIYEFQMLEYLDLIFDNLDQKKAISAIKEMVIDSKYGSRDGKSFEQKLKPVFELFRQNIEVELISGAGNTDLLCLMVDNHNNTYKVNVDAKTSKLGVSQINAKRIQNHIDKHGSEYCIIVSSRFAKGVSKDIFKENMVSLKSETLGNYCIKEVISSTDGNVDYDPINKLVQTHKGYDISKYLDIYIEDKYGI